MSEDPGMNALDARLRRLMSGLDAPDGFEGRVRARIAAARPAEDRMAALEARRLAARRRLRRAALVNGTTLAGLGIGAAALVWRFAPDIERFAAGIVVPAVLADPLTIASLTLAAVALGLWPLLRTLPGLRLG